MLPNLNTKTEFLSDQKEKKERKERNSSFSFNEK
jgi:hypothetical protein